MKTVTFVIPEKDAPRAREIERHLREVVGLAHVSVRHKPFDPFSSDAELQPFEEARITVSYDDAETMMARVAEAFTALDVHILDKHEAD